MTTPSHPETGTPPLEGQTAAEHTPTTTSPPRERFPAPPRDTLSILRTFLDTQQRRVGLWNEYQDAMEGHLQAVLAGGRGSDASSPLLNGHHTTTNGDSSTSSHSEEQDRPARSSHAHSHPNPSGVDHHGGSTHYQSTPIPLSDPALLSRIISLVTSGLLDCAHETRTIALELEAPSSSSSSSSHTSPSSGQQDRSITSDSLASSTTSSNDLPSTAPPTNNGASQPHPPPPSLQPRPDLARLINKIQDVENTILRKIVRRDQLRRGWVSHLNRLEEEEEEGKENGSSTPSSVREEEEREVYDLTRSIERLRREEVVELMEEIRGEMADLQLGSG